MNVTGKIAVVTGGGRGIGRGIVLALAGNGADVVVADINLDDAAGVAAEVAELGRRSMTSHLDVTAQDSVEGMVHDVMARFQRIDVLVNNAGIYAGPGFEEREEANEDDWDMIYEVNVKGVVRVTCAVKPGMKDRRYGKIVNIASIAGRQGSPGNPPYAVSKTGVISYTQASALELAPYGINVNAICPGSLWTPMWERIAVRRSGSPVENPEGLGPRALFERTVQRDIPLKREQTPEDIGNLAAFLASDVSRNITGQSINVDGGLRPN
jgi:meso-butanediol dehydrogenase/(S,S)-butanediol dehydrogenase/diacetyl reductase